MCNDVVAMLVYSKIMNGQPLWLQSVQLCGAVLKLQEEASTTCVESCGYRSSFMHFPHFSS